MDNVQHNFGVILGVLKVEYHQHKHLLLEPNLSWLIFEHLAPSMDEQKSHKTMGIHNWTQTDKGTYIRPSARRIKDLMKLNRDQLRWIVWLFTGHCHLKGQLFKLGLMEDSTCERCLEEDDSATHILCDCEAISNLRSPVTWASSYWNQVTFMMPP
jgi:hypothetical protein